MVLGEGNFVLVVAEATFGGARPPPSTIYSALKTARSWPNTGTHSKRFHLAINGKIATANSWFSARQTNASRHVWAKIGEKHFSLLESSSIVLGPKGNSQVALTRMRMPGTAFPGPLPPHIPPEKAFFSIGAPASSGQYQGMGGVARCGRFHRVTEWEAGGIQIFDMESEPVALRPSGVDSVHVYIPRFVLDRFSDENGHTRIRDYAMAAGTRDDVILHWARTMLPFSDRPLPLPRLVIVESTDHLVLRTFGSDISRSEQSPGGCPRRIGGLATRSRDRAAGEHLEGDLALLIWRQNASYQLGRFMRRLQRVLWSSRSSLPAAQESSGREVAVAVHRQVFA